MKYLFRAYIHMKLKSFLLLDNSGINKILIVKAV